MENIIQKKYKLTFNFSFSAGVRLEKFIQKKCLTLNLPFRPSDMALVRD